MITLSVVIPTYNRLPRLREVIGGLERQTHPIAGFEVVVVSDGARDGTDQYLKTLASPLKFKAVFQENQGVAAARNHGIAAAVADLVLFVDDDVVPTPELVAEHLRLHTKQEGDIVVIGPMLTPPRFPMQPWVRWEQQKLYEQYQAMENEQWAPTARQFYTGNTSLSRRHVLAAGGFDPTFRRGEDVELAFRLAERGLTFVFNPRAIGYHYAERPFATWLATPYSYGRNDVIMARDKGQRWLLPTAFRELREQRHPSIRLLIKMCLGRPASSRIVLRSLEALATEAQHLRVDTVASLAYGGIFNLQYYQGVADELGGRERFFALARASAQSHLGYDLGLLNEEGI